MSPRGKAVPEVRRQLFDAAERVLANHGPSGLTSRAITNEAGLAKGLLYNHFADLDDLLAELVVDRFRLAAEGAATLVTAAGQGTVVENLAEAVLSLPGSNVLTVADLVASRPSLAMRVHDALSNGASGPREIERAFTDYLDAEQRLGRVAPDADTEALALALLGAVHHLLITRWSDDTDLRTLVTRIIAALDRGMAPARPATQA